MAKKTPNFGGLSLKDVARANTETDNKNSIAKSNIKISSADPFDDVKNSNANTSNAKKRTTKITHLDKVNSITENNNAELPPDIYSNAQNSNASIGNLTVEGTEKSIAQISIATNDIPVANTNAIKSNANNSIIKNNIAKNVNQALFARVRDYFYNLLGDNESVEVKFSEVIQNLEINPHSFYKYFRTLRETDFVVTKLRYSTEIRKRTVSE
jgi:hypothetical protein